MQNILILDSDPKWRKWLRQLLEWSALPVCVLESVDERGWSSCLAECLPSVVIAAPESIQMDSREIVLAAREYSPNAKVVLFLDEKDPREVRRLPPLESAYVLSKRDAVSDIIAVLNDVLYFERL